MANGNKYMLLPITKDLQETLQATYPDVSMELIEIEFYRYLRQRLPLIISAFVATKKRRSID